MTPIISSERPIAVISPSGAHDPERLELGLAIAQKAGLNLMLLDGAKARHGYLAGTDEQRTSQIIEAFKNPAYGAVWALRGGFGATRILQHLPFDTFSPKPFIGFSDVVALMPSLYQRGFPVIHGPVVQSLPTTNDASLRHLFSF